MPLSPARETFKRRRVEATRRGRSRSPVRRSPQEARRENYRPREPSPLKRSAWRRGSVTSVVSDYSNAPEEEFERMSVGEGISSKWGKEKPLPSLDNMREMRQAPLPTKSTLGPKGPNNRSSPSTLSRSGNCGAPSPSKVTTNNLSPSASTPRHTRPSISRQSSSERLFIRIKTASDGTRSAQSFMRD